MSQKVSDAEAADLLKKLFDERTPVFAFLHTGGFKASAAMPGFIDSATRDAGISISVSGPPVDVKRGYIRFPAFAEATEFSYGERRELKGSAAEMFEGRGDSALVMTLSATKDRLVLLFDI